MSASILPSQKGEAPAALGTSGSHWTLRRWLLLIGLASLLVLWLAVGWITGSRREEALQAEFRQNANIARALQEQTERVFATVGSSSNLRDQQRTFDCALINVCRTGKLRRKLDPFLLFVIKKRSDDRRPHSRTIACRTNAGCADARHHFQTGKTSCSPNAKWHAAKPARHRQLKGSCAL